MHEIAIPCTISRAAGKRNRSAAAVRLEKSRHRSRQRPTICWQLTLTPDEIVERSVPHRERNAVKPVLDAQQQQRIGAVAIDDFCLNAAQAPEFDDGVAGIHADGKQGHDKACDQSRSRGAAVQNPGIPVGRSAFNSAFLLLPLAL